MAVREVFKITIRSMEENRFLVLVAVKKSREFTREEEAVFSVPDASTNIPFRLLQPWW